MIVHTRETWHVHVDMASIGRDPTIAKTVASMLISDHTDVAVDTLEFYVSDDRVLVRALNESDANALVQNLDPLLVASRQWLSIWGHNVFATQTKERLEFVEGIGAVWIQSLPGKVFKIIYPTHLYSAKI